MIVIARADHVRKLGGWEQWRVRYTFTHRIRGDVPETKIDDTVEPGGMCDNDYEEPKLGGYYVLYMQRISGKLTVGARLSIAEARKRDPMFARRAPG